jgi:hypothetical protein
VQHLGEALRMAQRLGNDTMISTVTANLAICLGRLGRFDEQTALLGEKVEFRSSEFGGFYEIQTLYAFALGLAYRGQRQRALEAVAAGEERFSGSLPGWMARAWTFWKADVLLMAGKRQEAIQTACDCLSEMSPQTCTPAFVGPYARWLGVTGRLRGDTRSISIVETFESEIERFDTVDQAEILCARRMLEMIGGNLSKKTAYTLEKQLDKLPGSLRHQLTVLEALPTH